MPWLPYPIVDAHVHLFPDRLFRAIRDWFRQHGRPTYYEQPTPELIHFLAEQGVGRFLVLNYAHKPDISRGLNRWNHELGRRYPQAVCFGALHAADEHLLRVAEEALVDLGLAGFKLHLQVQGFSADDERLLPVYERVMELGKLLIFHAGTAAPDAECVGVRHFARLMRRYPKLKAMVAHLGAYECDRFLDLGEEYPSLWFDTSFTFVRGGQGFAVNVPLERVVALQDRLLFGSDFPNIAFSFEDAIAGFLDLQLGEQFYRRVCAENAARFLSGGIATGSP